MIDLVVVNLYEFEKNAGIENIDIGGLPCCVPPRKILNL